MKMNLALREAYFHTNGFALGLVFTRHMADKRQLALANVLDHTVLISSTENKGRPLCWHFCILFFYFSTSQHEYMNKRSEKEVERAK